MSLVKPVSYTHLDVYKRQLQILGGRQGQAPGDGFDVDAALKPQGFEAGADQGVDRQGGHGIILDESFVSPRRLGSLYREFSKTCLLYTSRCV